MLLYCCLRTRVLDTPNLPYASRIRAPTITIKILVNMRLVTVTHVQDNTQNAWQ